jgi:hypothetical protein
MVGFMACANSGFDILLGMRSDAVRRKLERAVLRLEISPRFKDAPLGGLEMELERTLESLVLVLAWGEGVFWAVDVLAAAPGGEYNSSNCRLADKNGSYRSNKPLKRVEREKKNGSLVDYLDAAGLMNVL